MYLCGKRICKLRNEWCCGYECTLVKVDQEVTKSRRHCHCFTNRLSLTPRRQCITMSCFGQLWSVVAATIPPKKMTRAPKTTFQKRALFEKSEGGPEERGEGARVSLFRDS